MKKALIFSKTLAIARILPIVRQSQTTTQKIKNRKTSPDVQYKEIYWLKTRKHTQQIAGK